jgi:hypothetical protein
MAATSITTVGIPATALVGPTLSVQIRGPGLSAVDGNAQDLTARFTADGAVGILMAADETDIQELSIRWYTMSERGWFVGMQTTAADLQQAYDDVGDGGSLRVLIARNITEVRALSRLWRQTV